MLFPLLPWCQDRLCPRALARCQPAGIGGCLHTGSMQRCLILLAHPWLTEISSSSVSAGVNPSVRTWVPSSGPAAVTGQRPCPYSCGGDRPPPQRDAGTHMGPPQRLLPFPAPSRGTAAPLSYRVAGWGRAAPGPSSFCWGKQPGWQVWVVPWGDAGGPLETSSGLCGSTGSGTSVGEGDAGQDGTVWRSLAPILRVLHHELVSLLAPLSPGIRQLLCRTWGWQRQLEVVDLCLTSAAAASALDWAGEVLWSGFSGGDVFKMKRAVDGADKPCASQAAQGGPRAHQSGQEDRYSHPPGFFRASSLVLAADGPLSQS